MTAFTLAISGLLCDSIAVGWSTHCLVPFTHASHALDIPTSVSLHTDPAG